MVKFHVFFSAKVGHLFRCKVLIAVLLHAPYFDYLARLNAGFYVLLDTRKATLVAAAQCKGFIISHLLVANGAQRTQVRNFFC